MPSWRAHKLHYYLFTAANLTHVSNQKPLTCESHTVSIFSVDTTLSCSTISGPANVLHLSHKHCSFQPVTEDWGVCSWSWHRSVLGKAYCSCLWPVPFKNKLGPSGSVLCKWGFFFSVVLYVIWDMHTFYFRIVVTEIPKKLRPVECLCSDMRFIFLTGSLYIVASVQGHCALSTMCSSTAFAWVMDQTFRLTHTELEF